MKKYFIYLLLAAYKIGAAEPNIVLSTRYLDDSLYMQQTIDRSIEAYSEGLILIRDKLKESLDKSENNHKTLMNISLEALDTLIKEHRGSSAVDLIPFVNLAYSQELSAGGDEQKTLFPDISNIEVRSVLNYVIDGILNARMEGAYNSVTDDELESMLRFYAGNPAQTSELSGGANNRLLFLFGDRLLECLSSKLPDRIDAFYAAVKDSRENTQRNLQNPSPNVELCPESERPTADQLQRYEDAFKRLEILAADGVLPKSVKKYQSLSSMSQKDTRVSQMTNPPKGKGGAQSDVIASTTDKAVSVTSWGLIGLLAIVLVIGLSFWLKRPASN